MKLPGKAYPVNKCQVDVGFVGRTTQIPQLCGKQMQHNCVQKETLKDSINIEMMKKKLCMK